MYKIPTYRGFWWRWVVFAWLSVFAAPMSIGAKVVFVSPTGDDKAEGTILHPLATLPEAHARIQSGDTVYFRGGTYHVDDAQIMRVSRNYCLVFSLTKGGSSKGHTCFMGYPGERPVFDFSALYYDGRHRFAAFSLDADYLHLRNFEIVGVPVRVKGHTQSECVSAAYGSHCIVENLAMHDGMAIGYYQKHGSDNLVINCDAYNNYDDFSEGEYGGNVDGFGFHLNETSETGNRIQGCRAWRNSDDGFDLINCNTSVEISHCWAFFNGFKPTADKCDTLTFERAGDGNGFKAGGWGMGRYASRCPEICPEHRILNSMAYRNKANGFYANHHLAGCVWKNNTAWANSSNFNMVNRKSRGEAVDVPGYGHVLQDNLSYEFANKKNGGHLVMCDAEKSSLENNSFQPDGSNVQLYPSSFVSLRLAELFVERDAEGNLPPVGLLHLDNQSGLPSNMGW